MGSLGGRAGPGVGGFGPLPLPQSCLGNSVVQDGHRGLVLPCRQSLAKFLPSLAQFFIHVPRPGTHTPASPGEAPMGRQARALGMGQAGGG